MKKYEKSIQSIGNGTVYMANDNGKDTIFSTDETLGFIGEKTEYGKYTKSDYRIAACKY